MPKYKKQPKNNFTFFMEDMRRKKEAEGYRFKGGMKEVAEMCAKEWQNVPAETKEKYAQMAKEWKEKEKGNLGNKFTCSGESYASVERRKEEELKKKNELNELFRQMVHCDVPEDRIFILMHAIPSCEVPVTTSDPHGEKVKDYFPLEFALAAFSLRDGLICSTWSLVNTEEVPTGYLSEAKNVQEETMLPLPGSPEFQEIAPSANKFGDILGNVRKFIETWGSGYPDERYMIFVGNDNLLHSKGTIEWLVKRVEENHHDNQLFLSRLRFYRLPLLYIELCDLASRKDKLYHSEVVQFRNITLAQNKLAHGRYDYKTKITCRYHMKGDNNQKMHMCCANYIQRRIFIILDEFVGPFNIQVSNQHKVDMFEKSVPERLQDLINKIPTASSSSAGKSETEQKRSNEPNNRGSDIKATAENSNTQDYKNNRRENESDSKYESERRSDRNGRGSNHYRDRDESSYDRKSRDGNHDRTGSRDDYNDRKGSRDDYNDRKGSRDDYNDRKGGRDDYNDRRDRDRYGYGRDNNEDNKNGRDYGRSSFRDNNRNGRSYDESHASDRYGRNRGDRYFHSKPEGASSSTSCYKEESSEKKANQNDVNLRGNDSDSRSLTYERGNSLKASSHYQGEPKPRDLEAGGGSPEEGEIKDGDTDVAKTERRHSSHKQDQFADPPEDAKLVASADYVRKSENISTEGDRRRSRWESETVNKSEVKEYHRASSEQKESKGGPSVVGGSSAKRERNPRDVSPDEADERCCNAPKKRKRDSASENPLMDSSSVSPKPEISDETGDRAQTPDRRDSPASPAKIKPVCDFPKVDGGESPGPSSDGEELESVFTKPLSPPRVFNNLPRGRGRGSRPPTSLSWNN